MDAHSSQPTGLGPSATRTARAAALVAMVLAIILILAGCGSDTTAGPSPTDATGQAPAPSDLRQSGPQAADTRCSAAQPAWARKAEMDRSLHERVMAGRDLRAEQTLSECPPESGATPGSATASTITKTEPAGPDSAGTATVIAGGQTPIYGIWSGSADRLTSHLLAVCPTPYFTVPAHTLAEYYVHYCAEAGLRADLLWAQMLHETGYGRYGGDVRPEQNNFAGLGAVGGGACGATFATAEQGVKAHIAHMVAYVYPRSPVPWANNITDPRFDLVHPKGAAVVLSDLDGRWAVPGIGYGERIEAIAQQINAPR